MTTRMGIEEINGLFASMEDKLRHDLEASACATDAVQFQPFYDAACRVQAHELTMLLKTERFDDLDDLRAVLPG